MTKQSNGTDAQQSKNAAEILSEISEDTISDDLDCKAITDLQSAIEGVTAKIGWHEEEIEKRLAEIRNHRLQIENLRESLRKVVGPILGQSLPSSNGTNDTTTSTLILERLKKAKTALDTKTIKSYLEEHGNDTRPSVELSRMVKKGLLVRSGRGFYKLK